MCFHSVQCFTCKFPSFSLKVTVTIEWCWIGSWSRSFYLLVSVPRLYLICWWHCDERVVCCRTSWWIWPKQWPTPPPCWYWRPRTWRRSPRTLCCRTESSLPPPSVLCQPLSWWPAPRSGGFWFNPQLTPSSIKNMQFWDAHKLKNVMWHDCFHLCISSTCHLLIPELVNDACLKKFQQLHICCCFFRSGPFMHPGWAKLPECSSHLQIFNRTTHIVSVSFNALLALHLNI